MTIDETIAKEKANAEKLRKDNENCKYKSEYGCKGCADYYSKPCIECAEEHEQLAEWLEELKALRNGLKIKCDNLNEALEKGKKIGYNKAIDDFIRKCEMESRVILDEITHLSYYGLSMRELQRIAEQLKEGAKNEQSSNIHA